MSAPGAELHVPSTQMATMLLLVLVRNASTLILLPLQRLTDDDVDFNGYGLGPNLRLQGLLDRLTDLTFFHGQYRQSYTLRNPEQTLMFHNCSELERLRGHVSRY